jgi:hypothetical protein
VRVYSQGFDTNFFHQNIFPKNWHEKIDIFDNIPENLDKGTFFFCFWNNFSYRNQQNHKNLNARFKGG